VLLQPLGRKVVPRSGLPGLRAVDLIEKGAQLAQAVELQQVDGARAVERLARFQPVRALAVLVSMGAQPQVRGAAAARAGADQSSWNPPCVATWSVPGGPTSVMGTRPGLITVQAAACPAAPPATAVSAAQPKDDSVPRPNQLIGRSVPELPSASVPEFLSAQVPLSEVCEFSPMRFIVVAPEVRNKPLH
jgi:hypothetical protein